MKIGAIGIRTKIIVGDAATWYLVKKYVDSKMVSGGDVTKAYVDQQDALKVDKVEGHSLVPDTEINKLAGYPELENLGFSHAALTDKNSEADFQHLTQAQVDVLEKLITLPAQVGAASYRLSLNIPTLISGTLPTGLNSALVLPTALANNRNESVLHFSTGAALPTLVYSGFTPVWLGGNAISMKINKQYTIVFEQVNGIVKTSFGEY